MIIKGLWLCRVLVPVLWVVMPVVWIVGLVGCVLYEVCDFIESRHIMMRQAWPVLARLSAEQQDAMLGAVDGPPSDPLEEAPTETSK